MTQTPAYAAPAARSARGFGARAAFLTTLAVIELPLIAFLYSPAMPAQTELWWTVRTVLREFVPFSIFFIAALAVLATPQRRVLFETWRSAVKTHSWAWLAAVNIIGFALLVAVTLAFNARKETFTEPPWTFFFLWTLGVGAVYAVLALAFAPLSYWRRAVVRHRMLITIAAGAAAIVEAAALLSQRSWNALSEATFQLSAMLLRLFEDDVIIEPARRVIGIGDFKVNIAPACSGYEGIGLVLTFLGVYLYMFRSVLRFPNVYLILPIGVAAIWFLNGVRIVALVSLGANISPVIALTGFHSQAGWMMFLVVTIAIMFATHRISFFHDRDATLKSAPPSKAFKESVALLAPFLAMTAAGIVAAAFTAEGQWLYALRVIAIGAALLVGWRFYTRLNWRIDWTPILLGAIVGAVWIVTDPGRGQETALGVWLQTLTPAALAAWLALRAFGTVLLVPIAEELAFRGYLHRKLIADKFETVAEGTFSWKAFLVSSALFGVLHERWLAGALAGAVFAFALYRSGKIAGAIAAHMTANAIIALWAIVFAQWSLL